MKMVALHDRTYTRLRQMRDSSCGTFSETVDDLLILAGLPDLKYENVSMRSWDEK
jgi:hypothetical protein